MHLLVTAGNTLAPVDRVRALTNVFTGRTGTAIARYAHQHGHAVTLLTSHPELATGDPPVERWALHTYRTFEDLETQLESLLTRGAFDAVIHSAAVSDYRTAGVYAPAPGTRFVPESLSWQGEPPRLVDVRAGKVKSDAPELWLRLARTPKLIDRFRTDWRFAGVLVKFKLEVGIADAELLRTAERSRQHSGADLMVANTLEGNERWAYLGPLAGTYRRVSRQELAGELVSAVEARHRERTHG